MFYLYRYIYRSNVTPLTRLHAAIAPKCRRVPDARQLWRRAMELTVTTVLIAFAGVFLICFMKGAFGGGFSIVGIPLLSFVMDPVTAGGLLAPLFIAMDLRFATGSHRPGRNRTLRCCCRGS